MNEEKILRQLIGAMLNEAIDPALTGNVGGKPAIVLGPNAKKFLLSRGMTSDQISLVFNRINNITIEQFQKYDEAFKKYGTLRGLEPALLKAMAIEETTLGKNLKNQQGSTAAGIIQITKPTLETLNMNLPPEKHYDYNTLLSDPVKSIGIAAHYIKDYLIDKRNLKDEAAFLQAYKTSSDAPNYVIRVRAFKEFVKIVGFN